jgi:hypothetical protein
LGNDGFFVEDLNVVLCSSACDLLNVFIKASLNPIPVAHALMRPLRMASSYGAVYRFASTRCFVPFQHAICHPFAGDAPVRGRVACDEPAVEPLPLPAYVLLDRHAARHEAKAVRAHACVRAPLILPRISAVSAPWLARAEARR